MNEFLAFTAVPMACAVLAAMACALPGNFLILRRQAMVGDAIAHVVLPGIVVAFLLTGRVSTWPMLLGAAGAAVLAVVLIEAVRRAGRVEPGAAMGIVFTAMFAGGVLLLEASDTSGVHLDVEHALMGNLESLIWLDATGWGALLDPVALAGLPEELPRLAGVLVVNALLLRLAWRPLVLATFDEGHARALGLPVRGLALGLVLASALGAVAAFGAVGAILVIAMFVCPPAAARLMTDRLGPQVAWSMAFAALSAVGGVILAGYGPGWLGASGSVSAAGMVAVLAGLILAMAAMAGPCRRRAGA